MKNFRYNLNCLEDFDNFFKDYCKKNEKFIYPKLDFTQGGDYNAYLDERTGMAFVWFVRGVFSILNQMEEK